MSQTALSVASQAVSSNGSASSGTLSPGWASVVVDGTITAAPASGTLTLSLTATTASHGSVEVWRRSYVAGIDLPRRLTDGAPRQVGPRDGAQKVLAPGALTVVDGQATDEVITAVSLSWTPSGGTWQFDAAVRSMP